MTANPTDPNVAVVGWVGPTMYQYNPNTTNYDAFMGLQPNTGYTDGRITFLKPVDFDKNVDISGSVTITGSMYVSDIPSGSTLDEFIVYNTGSGLFERRTGAGGGGGTFPYTGDAVITGSLEVSQTIKTQIYLNPQVITGTQEVPVGFNGTVTGPVSISGTVTVSTGSVFTII